MGSRAGILIWGFVIGTMLILAGLSRAAADYVAGTYSSPTLYDVDVTHFSISNPRALWPAPAYLGGLSYSPVTGQLYGLVFTSDSTSSGALARIDPASGQTTIVGPLGINDVYEGDLDFNPVDGKLYGIQQVVGHNYYMFQIDTQTGAASHSVQLSVSAYSNLTGMFFSPKGTLYVLDTSTSSNGAWVWKLNATTGGFLGIVNTTISNYPVAGCAYDPYWGEIYTMAGSMNPSLGSQLWGTGLFVPGDTHLFNTFSNIDDFAAMAIVRTVPEPGAALFLAGLLPLATFRRHNPAMRVASRHKCGDRVERAAS